MVINLKAGWICHLLWTSDNASTWACLISQLCVSAPLSSAFRHNFLHALALVVSNLAIFWVGTIKTKKCINYYTFLFIHFTLTFFNVYQPHGSGFPSLMLLYFTLYLLRRLFILCCSTSSLPCFEICSDLICNASQFLLRFLKLHTSYIFYFKYLKVR